MKVIGEAMYSSFNRRLGLSLAKPEEKGKPESGTSDCFFKK
jgi:hypothetical protein